MCHGQLIESGTRKARKLHQCWWCGEDITPGAEYEFRTVVGGDYEGFSTTKTHPPCAAEWQDAVHAHGDEFCVGFGEGRALWEGLG